MENKNSTTHKMPSVVSIAAVFVIIAAIMAAENFVTQLLMALFISVICVQPVRWLVKKKVPQTLAVFLIFMGVIGMFLGFGELISNSLSSFSEDIIVYEDNLGQMWKSILQFLNSKGLHLSMDNMSGLYDPSKVMSFTATFLSSLGGFMGNALTIFFLALFLLLEVDSIAIKAKAIMHGSTQSLSYYSRIGSSIRHYLSIKTLTSLLTGCCIWVCLAIIGVDYAIIWALIAFLMNYIPNIGSIIAAIPAVLFALIQLGFGGFLWTAVVFVAINMIVGSGIEPKIMGRGMGLSTFVVFVSLIFFGFMLGTVGMFLSVPLTMAIKIMLEQSPKTQWVAIMLGSKEEALAIANNNDSNLM